MHRLLHIVLVIFHRIVDGIAGTAFHYGPAVLAKYSMPCAWLLGALALAAAYLDLTRKRILQSLLWVCMAAFLFLSFWFETTLYDPKYSGDFALASLAVDLILVLFLVVDSKRKHS